MRYVSHHPLESMRRQVFASAFPKQMDAQMGEVYQVRAESHATGNMLRMREFTVLSRAGTEPTLVEGACQITLEDIAPSECIEYTFPQEPDHWRMAQVSREALETYRDTKFESWRTMLEEPTCEA